MSEQPVKWVKVSTELLAQIGEWSEPVRVRVTSDVGDVLELEFQRDVRAAAAPELYEALLYAYQFLPARGDRYIECHGDKCRQLHCLSCYGDAAVPLEPERITAALAKARGETP